MTDLLNDTIAEYLDASARSLTSVDRCALRRAVDLLLDAYLRKSTIYTIGNGGSASTSMHFAADLGKFATGDKPGFAAFDLTANTSSLTAWTNDEGWNGVYSHMLAPLVREGDIVIAFSVHGGTEGWSGNLVKGLKLARERGAQTIGFAGDGGGQFKEVCDVSIIVPQVPDVLLTPVTESLHVSLFHLLCTCTRRALSSAGGHSDA
ncbi:SIS domain-containing protein [Streptomyces sp. NPDC020747]|uniref:SIS domain-containing protein n=1 Tax=Streptomyces sp. NPDC020747 TaxID=3365086 RepID=UPI003799F63C